MFLILNMKSRQCKNWNCFKQLFFIAVIVLTSSELKLCFLLVVNSSSYLSNKITPPVMKIGYGKTFEKACPAIDFLFQGNKVIQ